MTRALVVMGVTGCGKSTLGMALARALGWQFIEGDSLHPVENVEKMRSGIALNDEDRAPFLRSVAAAIAAGREAGVVASCSALKRQYRDSIRAQAGNVRFVLPLIDRDKLKERLAQRQNHFMPPALLDSQLATLEMPSEDEGVITVDAMDATEAQVKSVLAAMSE